MAFKNLAARRAYEFANRETILQQRLVYRTANRARLAAKQRAYQLANRETILQQQLVYRAANRAHLAAKQRAYLLAYPEHSRTYYLANQERIVAARRIYYLANCNNIAEWNRTRCLELSNSYLRHLIARVLHISAHSIPPSIVAAKREHLKVLRLLKEQSR